MDTARNHNTPTTSGDSETRFREPPRPLSHHSTRWSSAGQRRVMDFDEISDTKVWFSGIFRLEKIQNFDFPKIDSGRNHTAPTASDDSETRFRAPAHFPVTQKGGAV